MREGEAGGRLLTSVQCQRQRVQRVLQQNGKKAGGTELLDLDLHRVRLQDLLSASDAVGDFAPNFGCNLVVRFVAEDFEECLLLLRRQV